MKIGILCPADIAVRRFIPSLSSIDGLELAGIATYSNAERSDLSKEEYELKHEKQQKLISDAVATYGGKEYKSFQDLLEDSQVDAVYIPLPPAHHFKWALKALQSGKHVLLEKPFCTSFDDANALVLEAQKRGLALHENYMFLYHNQISYISNVINSGEIGKVRLFRAYFGFPHRGYNDFRYKKDMGGGALLDAGGYTLRYGSELLGDTARVVYSNLVEDIESDVDIFGSIGLVNDDAVTAQLAFGMDNEYKCEFEAWGSKGTLYTNRIFTAPKDYSVVIDVRKSNVMQSITLDPDDSFRKSIDHFITSIDNKEVRESNYNSILRQAKLLSDALDLAKFNRDGEKHEADSYRSE